MRVAPASVFSIEYRMRSFDCKEFIYCIPLFSKLSDARHFETIIHDYLDVNNIVEDYVAFIALANENTNSHPNKKPTPDHHFLELIDEYLQHSQGEGVLSEQHIAEANKIRSHFDINPRSTPALLCLINGYPDAIVFENINLEGDEVRNILLDLREIAEDYAASTAVDFQNLLHFEQSVKTVKAWDAEVSRRSRDVRRKIKRLLYRYSNIAKPEVDRLAQNASAVDVPFEVKRTAVLQDLENYLDPTDVCEVFSTLSVICDLQKRKERLIAEIQQGGERLAKLQLDDDHDSLQLLYQDVERLAARGKKIPSNVKNSGEYSSISWRNQVSFADTMFGAMVNAQQVLKGFFSLFS